MRWAPAVVNSAFLLGAVTLPNVAVPDDTDSISIRNIASCAPIGPVASRYVDKKKVCRRARQEVLQSLKTGRDPDWDDVIRDSVPKVPNRPHHSPPSRRSRQRPKRHDTNSVAPPNASLTPPRTRSTSRTETRPSPEVPPPSAPGMRTPSRHVPTAAPTSRSGRSADTPWLLASGPAVIGLLTLLAAAVYLGSRRRIIFAGTMSLLSRLTQGFRLRSRATPPTTTRNTAPERARIASVLTKGASLTGTGAEDAARHIAMEILSRRRVVPTELVLSRPDAWQLFGMDIGTLQEDRIPGLILTDDHEHTRAILARQTSSRRLLLTYGNEGEALTDGRGQIPVLSISTRTDGTTTISADGAVTTTTDPSATDRLPLLTKDDAFNRLMSMPTRARRHDELGGAEENAPYHR